MDFGSMVVPVWKERDSRVFQHESHDFLAVINGIKVERNWWRQGYHRRLRELS
jgi:hypothetical protein